MRFSIRFADKIVGALVILALAILVVVIFMIGRSQRWFKYDYQYISYFESASGLSKNMPVQYKGFVIGYVKDFKLSDDDTVETIFTIFDEYRDRWVKEGSLVELSSSPIPGLGNAFNFYPGKGREELPEFSVIPDVNSEQGKRYIASNLSEKTESVDSINEILNNAAELMANLNLSLSAAPGSEDLPIAQTLRNIEKFTEKLMDPDGTIMLALDGDGEIYKELISMVSGITELIGDLTKTTNLLPTQLPIILNDLSISLRDLQDLMTAISNNPLLKGGVPERPETSPGGASQRNLNF